MNESEHFISEDVLDLQIGDKESAIFEIMSSNVHSLFKMYGIRYSANKNIPTRSIAIMNSDEGKLLNLTNILNNMGYGISKFVAGYRIYPLNGIEVTSYDRAWSDEQIIYHIPFPDDTYRKNPYVDILLLNE
jgi:hypothetical protein